MVGVEVHAKGVVAGMPSDYSDPHTIDYCRRGRGGGLRDGREDKNIVTVGVDLGFSKFDATTIHICH